MILHTVPGSPNGRKVEAVISHLGLEVEIRHRNLFNGELRGPDYLALNANAKAPTLVDGDFTLWETTAIMQYLCEKAGDSTLFPRSPRSMRTRRKGRITSRIPKLSYLGNKRSPSPWRVSRSSFQPNAAASS